MHQLFGRGWHRYARLLAAPGAIAIFAAGLAGCAPQGISVTFSKTPARGTTTIKVTVNTSGTITATSARIDSATATPVATSSAATFSFDLDTTPLSNTTHTLFVTSQTSTGSLSDQFPFTVDNTPTVLPPGFQQSTAFSGLTQPTAVRFSPDGRVFVAEKSGLIKVFASLTATTPTVFADLRSEVFNAYDRGLLGIALDPSFPTNPYVYVLYTLDAPIGGTP